MLYPNQTTQQNTHNKLLKHYWNTLKLLHAPLSKIQPKGTPPAPPDQRPGPAGNPAFFPPHSPQSSFLIGLLTYMTLYYIHMTYSK